MMQYFRLSCPGRWSFLLPILFAFYAGCDRGDRPELAEVHGRVTFAGKPLAGAYVFFTPVSGGRESTGFTDADGRYSLHYLRDMTGAKVGSHKVAVITAVDETKKETLPARYNSQTTLTAEVEAKPNEINFDLTK